MILPASDYVHAVTWGMQGPYGGSALYVYGVLHRWGITLRNENNLFLASCRKIGFVYLKVFFNVVEKQCASYFVFK